MRKILITGLALSLFFPSAFAATKFLTNYNQLLEAVNNGDDVRATVYFDKCSVVDKKSRQLLSPLAGASTRINFNVFSHYKVLENNVERFTVATSMSMLVEHRFFGMIMSYGRLRVYEDNSAVFHAAYYDPATFRLKGSTDLQCQLSNGADQNGLVLIDKD